MSIITALSHRKACERLAEDERSGKTDEEIFSDEIFNVFLEKSLNRFHRFLNVYCGNDPAKKPQRSIRGLLQPQAILNFYAESFPYLSHILHSVLALMDNFYKFLILLYIHCKNSHHYSQLRKYNLRFL
jgi:hypothetical protein